eukprot:gene6436-8856_t
MELGDIYKSSDNKMVEMSSEAVIPIEEDHVQISTMRSTTARSTYDKKNPHRNLNERDQRTYDRRGCFRWLPIYFSNDLVHGSWWYVFGSFVSMIIPLFPLISLYEGFWPRAGYLNVIENTAAYALLVFMGVFYTIGSWAFLRAVEEPEREPLFTWYHFSNDELFAMWMFTIGTVPSIPCMGLYVYYNPENADFQLAFALCIIFSVACFILTLACYPSVGRKKEPTKILSYMMCACLCKKSCYGRHFANDWLIAMWVVVVGCFMACIMSAGQLIYYCSLHERRGIFDYSTGLFNCFQYLVGSMYLLAGSYPVEEFAFIPPKEDEVEGKASVKNEIIEVDQMPIETA